MKNIIAAKIKVFVRTEIIYKWKRKMHTFTYQKTNNFLFVYTTELPVRSNTLLWYCRRWFVFSNPLVYSREKCEQICTIVRINSYTERYHCPIAGDGKIVACKHSFSAASGICVRVCGGNNSTKNQPVARSTTVNSLIMCSLHTLRNAWNSTTTPSQVMVWKTRSSTLRIRY